MCRFVSVACALAISIVLWGVAQAATMAELRRIDFNRNGALDAGPEFRAYLELEKLTGDLNSSQLARVGSLQADIAVLGSIPLTQLAEKEKVTTSSCDRGQGFYLRRNKLDVSIYNASIDDSAAEGAAISFTNNFGADVETAEIDAMAAWVFARNPCRPRPPSVGTFQPYISGYALRCR